MAESRKPPPKNDAAGAARLRRAADVGRTDDKVDHPDPAAAPLGTDAEAAGTPPTAEQVRMAEAREVDRAPAAPEPGLPRHRRPGVAQTLWWLLVVIVLLIIAAWIF